MIIKKIILYAAAVLQFFVLLSCGEKKGEQPSKTLYEFSSSQNIPVFNSENAYDYVEEQTKFGPRNPNSIGHQKTLNYLKNTLSQFADEVQLQSFIYKGYDEVLNLTNIIAKFNPDKKNRILLCAHWDTRPRAEHAKDESKKNLPIIGANDGGSGVGVLLETARILKQNKIDYGVDIVLFDGEDYGKENDLNNYCLGSKYFAANYYKTSYPVFGILFDMVGDKEAVFPKEGHSLQFASEVINQFWNSAELKSSSIFLQEEKPPVYDDHVPLNQAGIKTIDIIDGDLIGADSPNERRNYWHSHDDTMQNIGKETLQQVGDVLVYFLYTLKFNY
ncbi:MAG: M28 family peptidase [Ignavibacteriaceae bacterium]